MPVTLGWQDIAVRLALTILAGGLIGLNRGEHGRPAGLRTCLLVCLAASMAMIQTNLLLGMANRPKDSFVMLDLMRLPLGILSGMGFIGGGVILKRGDIVIGVTTAATLWFITVLGLCFGGGQIALGSVSLALGLGVLWGLKRIELWLPQERRGSLCLMLSGDGPSDDRIRRSIVEKGFAIASVGTSYDAARKQRRLSFALHWRGGAFESRPPEFITELVDLPGVARVTWRPEGQQI